jgi:hypothetical protein
LGFLSSAELYDPNAPIAIPKNISASTAGEETFLICENFDIGAVILLHVEEQRTANDDQDLKNRLIGKKAGKRIQLSDKLQVRNPNCSVSEAFTFNGA